MPHNQLETRLELEASNLYRECMKMSVSSLIGQYSSVLVYDGTNTVMLIALEALNLELRETSTRLETKADLFAFLSAERLSRITVRISEFIWDNCDKPPLPSEKILCGLLATQVVLDKKYLLACQIDFVDPCGLEMLLPSR